MNWEAVSFISLLQRLAYIVLVAGEDIVEGTHRDHAGGSVEGNAAYAEQQIVAYLQLIVQIDFCHFAHEERT